MPVLIYDFKCGPANLQVIGRTIDSQHRVGTCALRILNNGWKASLSNNSINLEVNWCKRQLMFEERDYSN